MSDERQMIADIVHDRIDMLAGFQPRALSFHHKIQDDHCFAVADDLLAAGLRFGKGGPHE